MLVRRYQRERERSGNNNTITMKGSKRVHEILKEMSVYDKIGQMSQIDLSDLVAGDTGKISEVSSAFLSFIKKEK